MINFKVLELYGTTRERAKAVFTQWNSSDLAAEGLYLLDEMVEKYKEENEGAEPSRQAKEKMAAKIARKNYKAHRDYIENRVRPRIQEGRAKFLGFYKHYMVCDLSWDNPYENMPLSLIASGKINIKMHSEIIDEFEKTFGMKITERERDGKIKTLDVPRLWEMHMSLVRPTLTRLVAELSDKANSQDPFLKYDPRNKVNQVERLRADVITQRAEMWVDSHGMRSMNTQFIRRFLMHGKLIGFTDCGWRQEKQVLAPGEDPKIVREGFNIFAPHPTCMFYDDSHPLSTLNSDNGISWLGYWKVVRAYEVVGNPSYWNHKNIPYSNGPGSVSQTLSNAKGALDYVCPEALKISSLCDQNNGDAYFCTPTANPEMFDGLISRFEAKDRETLIGFYSAEKRDTPMILTEFFDRAIPRDIGLGNYPYPVWMRHTLVNDDVIINTEFLPSRPAAAMEWNQNDSRTLNPSIVHDMLPYEDHIRQLLGQLLWLMKLQSLVLVAINTDIVDDDKVRTELIDHIEGRKFYTKVSVLQTSFKNLGNMLLSRASSGAMLKAMEVITFNITSEINTIHNAITTLQGMMERNLMISPQQMAQLTTKETNATEIASVDKTTSIMSNFHSDGINEFWDAFKVIFYESLIAKGSNEVEVPIVETYPDDIMQAAGFERTDGYDGNVRDQGATVRGDTKNLVSHYIFTSRDHQERTLNSDIATTLIQLLQYVMQSEILVQKFGADQIANSFAEVFRLTGSPFKFEVLPPDKQELPSAQEMANALQQLSAQLQELEASDAEQEKALGLIDQALQSLIPQGSPQEQPVGVGA